MPSGDGLAKVLGGPAAWAGAGRIVVTDEMGMVEEGRHHELVAAGGIYRRLHAAQFGTVPA